MSHRPFLITVSLIGGINIILACIYCYFWGIIRIQKVQYAIKPFPVSLLIIQTLIYLYLYNLHRYAILILSGFCMCLVGDILLMFNSQIDYLIAMLFFALGYLCFVIALNLPAYRSSQNRIIWWKSLCSWRNSWKIMVSILPWIVFGIIFGFSFTRKLDKSIVFLSCIYAYGIILILLGFSSLVRIFHPERNRINLSRTLAFLGILHVIASDTLNAWNQFIKPIEYVDIIVILLYWIGLHLIGISTVQDWDYPELERMGSIIIEENDPLIN